METKIKQSPFDDASMSEPQKSPIRGHQHSKQSNYFPVILQITPRHIKAGIAGDPRPLACFETNNRKWHNPINDIDISEISVAPQFIDHSTSIEMSTLENTVRHIQKFDTFTKQWLYNHDILSFEMIHDSAMNKILEKSLYDVFYVSLLVPPRLCTVVIPEALDLPIPIKTAISSTLFQHFQIRSLVWVPSPLLSCISAGARTALVVEINWDTSCVVPVYDLRVIQSCVRYTKKSASWVHYGVLRALIDAVGGFDKLPCSKKGSRELFDWVEKFVQNHCYARVSDSQDTDSEKKFKLSDECEIPNSPRYEAIEEMLVGTGDYDIDELPILELITKHVVKELPIDCRAEILDQVIITGELALVPGVKSLIMCSLKRDLPLFKWKLIKSLGAWAGASLYCSTILMSSGNFTDFGELKGDKFLNNEQAVPDWVSNLYNLTI